MRELKGSQIKLFEPPLGLAYLEYHENTSKNNPGGLRHRKIETKVVTHYQNTNPQRYFIRLYKLYLSKCPDNVDIFFLKPLVKPKDNQWYTRQAVGHNVLGGTVKRLCEKANIPGRRTNHSLRASAATRLFHANVPEQMIMQVAGHRSTDGVRSYKQVARDQFKQVSQVLQASNHEADRVMVPHNQPIPSQEMVHEMESIQQETGLEKTDSKKMLQVTTKEAPVLAPPASSSSNGPQQIVLHDCNNINFNFQH